MTAKLKMLLQATSVLAVLLTTPAAVMSDPIVLSLSPSSQTGAGGSLVTFQGKFSNGEIPANYVNSVSVTLVGGPAGFTFDHNDFFAVMPLTAEPGFTIGPTNFFSVFIDLAVAPGLYIGSFSVLGGNDKVAENVLASKEFMIRLSAATTQVLESGAVFLFGLGLSGLAALVRRRRKSRMHLAKS